MEASPQAAAWKVVVRALGDFVPSRGLPSNHELAEALCPFKAHRCTRSSSSGWSAHGSS